MGSLDRGPDFWSSGAQKKVMPRFGAACTNDFLNGQSSSQPKPAPAQSADGTASFSDVEPVPHAADMIEMPESVKGFGGQLGDIR